MSDPLIGKHLGQFEILEPVGQGGMATVYEAMQTAMNRIVAVKVLTAPMAGNAAFLARFKQEARMIASLEHTHILPVYDLGEQDGLVYIAMRYMSYGTLASRLARGPLPLRDISQWMMQIGSALDYAHQRGVIHRDVKPSNVLLDAQGDAYLADFGIAKWFEGSIDLTGSGVIGTPQYMSPEQGQGLKIDGRSDEYSLAVMAYEMTVGRLPFEAETPLGVVLKHVSEPLTPPNAINPRVPKAVSDVIARALSKNPDDRYPTTIMFAQALGSAISTAPLAGTAPLPSAEPTEEIQQTRTPMPRRQRRWRTLRIGLAILLIVLIGLGSALALSTKQPAADRPVAIVTLGPNVQIQTPLPGTTPAPTIEATVLPVTSTDYCSPPIFADNFDNPASGLPRGEQSGSTWGYVDGAYQLFIGEANKMQMRLIGPPLSDYEINVDAHFAAPNPGAYGVVVAARGSNDYYTLMIDGDQNYAITRHTVNGTQAIQAWTFAPALNRGQTINRLRVIQRGHDLAFYANDVLLKLINDDGDPNLQRAIGLAASSFGKGAVDARFNNLRVCPPPALSTRQAVLIDTFDDNRNGWAPQQFSEAGSSAIENGRFVMTAVYPGQPYGISNWNPNVAFDRLDLKVDAQIAEGKPDSRVGVLFGVQDIDNLYWFSLLNDGSYRLYRKVAGAAQTLAQGDASQAINPSRESNQIHLTVYSNTLTVAVNDQQLLQAAVNYTPGHIGFWCGVYQPERTVCTFDNLQVTGTPSTGVLTIYPFCNCRRDAYVGQPLEVKWRWGAKSIDLLDRFKTGTTMTVTLDGVPIAQPQQYWSKPRGVDSEAEMFWSYTLPAMDPGSHVLEAIVHSDEALTDGLDENGDGRLDTFGPGDIYVGYVDIVVKP